MTKDVAENGGTRVGSFIIVMRDELVLPNPKDTRRVLLGPDRSQQGIIVNHSVHDQPGLALACSRPRWPAMTAY